VASTVPNNEATQFKSGAEAVENGRKGGVASGEARRQKATMKKVLQDMLEEIPQIEGNDTNLTYKQLATLGVIKGAIDGNATNYKTILEVVGELSTQSEAKEPVININMINNDNLQEDFFKKEENNG
jgi:hypothetical protein